MPLIAMSREMGSLGRDVAASLAQGLGRRVVYQELIDARASRARVRKTHVERFLDGAQGLWERLDPDCIGQSLHTAERTFAFARDPSIAVLRGWGAAHLLRDVPHVIRVRICAPFELRVERMMARLHTRNREAVQAEVRLADEAAAAIAKRHFRCGARDAEDYDLVLSTERLTPGECVDELEWMLKRERFRETEASLAAVDDLALAWAVRSALLSDDRTAGRPVQVVCEGAAVTLRGEVDDRGQARAAAEIASAVSGVREVQSRLRAAGRLHR